MPRIVNTKSGGETPPARRLWAAPLAVVLAAVLFGSTGTVRALGPDDATTLGVGAVRLVVGALVLAGGVWALGRPWHGMRWVLVISGGVAVAAYQLTFFTGTQRTGVTLGTVTTLAVGPVVAGALDSLWSRRRPSVAWSSATALAIVGVVLAVTSSGSLAVDALGTVAAAAAGVSYAVYATTVGRLISGGADPLAAMAATFLVGAAMISPLLGVEPMGWVTTASGAAVSLHLGVATVAIAYALYAMGLTRLSVPAAVTLTLAEPVTAAVLGRLVLDEVVAPLGWVGIGLVVTGLVVVGRSAAAAPPVSGTVDDQ